MKPPSLQDRVAVFDQTGGQTSAGNCVEEGELEHLGIDRPHREEGDRGRTQKVCCRPSRAFNRSGNPIPGAHASGSTLSPRWGSRKIQGLWRESLLLHGRARVLNARKHLRGDPPHREKVDDDVREDGGDFGTLAAPEKSRDLSAER
jgi:hypothetical protein